MLWTRGTWSLWALALCGVFAGCGQTAVSMLVVRPALINAKPFGSTVSVAGFLAAQPSWVATAEQLRVEVERAILAGHGGVVPLVQHGGGLAISGTVDQITTRVQYEEKEGRCPVKKVPGGGEEQSADRPCPHRRGQWATAMLVSVRIVSSTGQVVYLRQLQRERTGFTAWVADAMPTMPDLRPQMATHRQELANEIAWLVVPHQERVTEHLYDCDPPAEKMCQDGARLLASSRYDEALNAYAAALQALQGNPKAEASDIAEIHWNRAIVAKYARNFQLAIQSLQEAIRLDDSARYRAELDNVQRAAADHERLLDQGLGAGGRPGGQP